MPEIWRTASYSAGGGCVSVAVTTSTEEDDRG